MQLEKVYDRTAKSMGYLQETIDESGEVGVFYKEIQKSSSSLDLLPNDWRRFFSRKIPIDII